VRSEKLSFIERKLNKLKNYKIKKMQIDLPKDKRYYSIGEVAKAFDVNASLIRFWDSEFDILKPKKNAKGNRMFTPEDITNLQLIYHLVKERGFTLEGAKIHLKEGQKKTLDKFEIIKKLEAIRNQLTNIKNEL
jgi:DNA-binding transcriptional MerR regulator